MMRSQEKGSPVLGEDAYTIFDEPESPQPGVDPAEQQDESSPPPNDE